MKRHSRERPRLVAFILCLVVCVAARSSFAKKPNVLIFYIDDLGYGDLSATGNKVVRTPHCDSIAKSGVRFNNSYVSACLCSPSRAGLMTGRYQQRFGFDGNAENEASDDRAPRALDLKETTFAQRFRALGYATGLVGKWHLGAGDGYLPTQRGFDEFYGFLPYGVGSGEPVPFYRGLRKVDSPPDHTAAFGRESEAFIDRHKTKPWFLYLAFGAVHAPHTAPAEYLKRFSHLDPKRAAYFAMVAAMDDAVGAVLARLRKHGLEENTLIFLASDNGGAPNQAMSNGPFRGTKWSLWEGGIRSPIFIQWKGHIPGGGLLPQMVNQLDWLPTALAAAGSSGTATRPLDGVNLLPLLQGKTDQPPHDALYWRYGKQYAVRQGDWKLVKATPTEPPRLFNLAADLGEKFDLASKEPAQVKQLQSLWDAWNANNEAPRWIDGTGKVIEANRFK
jgi:arylsulfatase A-like enzyme